MYTRFARTKGAGHVWPTKIKGPVSPAGAGAARYREGRILSSLRSGAPHRPTARPVISVQAAQSGAKHIRGPLGVRPDYKAKVTPSRLFLPMRPHSRSRFMCGRKSLCRFAPHVCPSVRARARATPHTAEASQIKTSWCCSVLCSRLRLDVCGLRVQSAAHFGAHGAHRVCTFCSRTLPAPGRHHTVAKRRGWGARTSALRFAPGCASLALRLPLPTPFASGPCPVGVLNRGPALVSVLLVWPWGGGAPRSEATTADAAIVRRPQGVRAGGSRGSSSNRRCASRRPGSPHVPVRAALPTKTAPARNSAQHKSLSHNPAPPQPRPHVAAKQRKTT